MSQNEISYIIRTARPDDAEQIHNAHMRSIQEICSRDYNQEQITVWGDKSFDREMRVSSIQNDYVLIVESQGEVKGFGHLKVWDEKNHAEIMGLYLTPEIVGKGIAKALVESLKVRAKKLGFQRLNLCSTITAKEFYLSQGFSTTKDKIDVTIGGVKIEAIPMEMRL